MEFLSSRSNRIVFIWILITLSISPAFATDPIDNRNYLLIGSMFLGPIIVLFSGKFLPKFDMPIFGLIILILILQIGFHWTTVKWTSCLFSFMFMVYFLAGIRTFIYGKFTPEQLKSILKYLIIAYAIVLLIQQFCTLTGLPVINQLSDYGEKVNRWKLNSLSPEPSHTARYLGLLMYMFLITNDWIEKRKISITQSYKKNKIEWLAFLWVMLTMMSGTAMIILALIITRYIRRKNIISIACIIGLIIVLGVILDFVPLQRSTNFLQATVTGDTKSMIATDHSASIRIVPTLLCLSRINPFSLNGWIGEGMGSTSIWMSHYMPGVPQGWSGGAMANYVLENGMIIGLYFLIYSFQLCVDKRYKLVTFGFWIMCIVLIGVNTQIGWLCIV